MATHISSQNLIYVRPLRISRVLEKIHIPLPHPRVVTITALLLGGPLIAALMLFEILPLSFLLGFIGFAMTGTGGILALILYGEI